MKPLVGLDTPALVEIAAAHGQSAFRGRQLSTWIYKKAVSEFDAMRDLPGPFRAALAENFVVNPLA
ncbi:23S rRNA (adenine(2503)-C(2))-methyltransferase RlmN, partial [Acinetobacter baumannii]